MKETRYKIWVETHDWTCEKSAEKAKLAMEKTIENLTPEDKDRWGQAWWDWDFSEDDDDSYLYIQEIHDACNQAELVGLEGWASMPTGGHSISITVSKYTC